MKFLYCENCDLLQPRSWYSRKYCQRCHQEAVIIRIPMGWGGYVSYIFSAIAAFLIVANLTQYDLGLDGWDIYIIFGLIAVAFVGQFFEVGYAQKKALARIKEHYPKHR